MPIIVIVQRLKVPYQNPGKIYGAHHQSVRAELERVFKEGLQDEWQEFPDSVSYAVYYEGAAVQGEVLMKPRIIDASMFFFGFCGSKRGRALQLQAAAPQAPQGMVASGVGAKTSDPAVAAAEAAGLRGRRA